MTPAAADFVLCTGPLEDHASLDRHEPVLAQCRARGLPMLCANPDLWVMRGEHRLVCAGLIAQRYAELGGRVTRCFCGLLRRCRAREVLRG